MIRSSINNSLLSAKAAVAIGLYGVVVFSAPSFAQEKIRIGYIGLSLGSLPLLAARELGTFSKNGVQAENLLLTFQLSSVASAAASWITSPGSAPVR